MPLPLHPHPSRRAKARSKGIPACAGMTAEWRLASAAATQAPYFAHPRPLARGQPAPSSQRTLGPIRLLVPPHHSRQAKGEVPMAPGVRLDDNSEAWYPWRRLVPLTGATHSHSTWPADNQPASSSRRTLGPILLLTPVHACIAGPQATSRRGRARTTTADQTRTTLGYAAVARCPMPPASASARGNRRRRGVAARPALRVE